MENEKTYIYDGSFNGFLSAIFTGFEDKLKKVRILKTTNFNNGLFCNARTITTNYYNAKSVWNAIQNKNNALLKNIYFAFLSDEKNIESLLYSYIRKQFCPQEAVLSGYSSTIALKVEKLAKTVAKEKRLMESSLSFRKAKDGVLYANIAADFNILPLISKYFRQHYPAQEWFIYDSKRKKALYHNMVATTIISIDFNGDYSTKNLSKDILKGSKSTTLNYLNNYFKSINLNTLINNQLNKNNELTNPTIFATNRIAV